MTELSPDPEGIVEQVVERAASKVADAATATPGTVTSVVGQSTLTRMEAIAALGTIIIMIAAGLWLLLDIRSGVTNNGERLKAACNVAALAAPQEETTILQLAECLR